LPPVTDFIHTGQPRRDCPYTMPGEKRVCHMPLFLSVLFKPLVFAGSPLRKFQGCDQRCALKILDCLSEASFQNLARLTEQTGPKGEIFFGAPFFWVLFLGRARKVSGARGRAPFRLHSLLSNIQRGLWIHLTAPLHFFRSLLH